MTLDVGDNGILGKVPSELGSIETLGRFLHSNLFVLANSYNLYGHLNDIEYLDLCDLDVEPWGLQPWLFRLTNLGKAVPMRSLTICFSFN